MRHQIVRKTWGYGPRGEGGTDLAVETLAAAHLKAWHHSIARLDVLDVRSNGLHDAHELGKNQQVVSTEVPMHYTWVVLAQTLLAGTLFSDMHFMSRKINGIVLGKGWSERWPRGPWRHSSPFQEWRSSKDEDRSRRLPSSSLWWWRLPADTAWKCNTIKRCRSETQLPRSGARVKKHKTMVLHRSAHAPDWWSLA